MGCDECHSVFLFVHSLFTLWQCCVHVGLVQLPYRNPPPRWSRHDGYQGRTLYLDNEIATNAPGHHSAGVRHLSQPGTLARVGRF